MTKLWQALCRCIEHWQHPATLQLERYIGLHWILFFPQYCESHCCSCLSALGSCPELTGWNQQVEIVGPDKVLPVWKETRCWWFLPSDMQPYDAICSHSCEDREGAYSQFAGLMLSHTTSSVGAASRTRSTRLGSIQFLSFWHSRIISRHIKTHQDTSRHIKTHVKQEMPGVPEPWKRWYRTTMLLHGGKHCARLRDQAKATRPGPGESSSPNSQVYCFYLFLDVL